MTWQELYAIARSLRQRADWLFDRSEYQLAGEGIWGALHYTARALTECFGRAAGQSLSDGHIPTLPNFPSDISQRKRQWRAARALHIHFYNSNLTAAEMERSRAQATALLNEAFGVLQSNMA